MRQEWFEIQAITIHTEEEVTYLQRELKRGLILWMIVILVHSKAPAVTNSVRSCLGFLPACCLKAQRPSDEEVVIMLFPSKNEKSFSNLMLYHTVADICHFLAVHNSSIGDLVTDWVTHSQYFYFWHYRVIQETCDLWDIWSDMSDEVTWSDQ